MICWRIQRSSNGVARIKMMIVVIPSITYVRSLSWKNENSSSVATDFEEDGKWIRVQPKCQGGSVQPSNWWALQVCTRKVRLKKNQTYLGKKYYALKIVQNIASKYLILGKGSCTNHVDHFLDFFDPHPSSWTVLLNRLY